MFYKKDESSYRNPIPGVNFKTLAHGDNAMLGEFRLSKGYEIPRHSHPQEQTGYLVSGRMIFHIGDETHETEPGDAWNIKGNVEHSVDVLEDCLVIEVFSPLREDYL